MIYTQCNTTRPVESQIVANKQYTRAVPDWQLIWDTVMGEREIKEQTTTYLPKPNTQSKDDAYTAYKTRAFYFNYMSDTLMGMYGILWQKNPQIKLQNKKMEDWAKSATNDNLTLMEQYRRTTFNSLYLGRYGMLLDIPSDDKNNDFPIIIPYEAPTIVNWGEINYKGRVLPKFVVFDESYESYNKQTLATEIVVKWKLCGIKTHNEDGEEIREPIYFTQSGEITSASSINTSAIQIKNMKFNLDPELVNDGGENIWDGLEDSVIVPRYKGKHLNYIPFIPVNVTNIDLPIEKPMLLGLAYTSLAIYRGDADYRQALFMQGQDTLFGQGMSATDVAIGAGAIITASNKESDLKYVGVSGQGLGEMRNAEKDLKAYANEQGINLTEKSSGDETGKSVEQHLSVRTASLRTVAKTSASAMAKAVEIVADWTSTTGEFTVMPNLEFGTSTDSADSVIKMVQAFTADSVKLPSRDLYEWLKRNDYTIFETFDEWEKNTDFNNIVESAVNNIPVATKTTISTDKIK